MIKIRCLVVFFFDSVLSCVTLCSDDVSHMSIRKQVWKRIISNVLLCFLLAVYYVLLQSLLKIHRQLGDTFPHCTAGNIITVLLALSLKFSFPIFFRLPVLGNYIIYCDILNEKL